MATVREGVELGEGEGRVRGGQWPREWWGRCSCASMWPGVQEKGIGMVRRAGCGGQQRTMHGRGVVRPRERERVHEMLGVRMRWTSLVRGV